MSNEPVDPDGDPDGDPNGIQGVQGIQGIQGIQGRSTGTQGIQGVEGPRGLPGRSAVTRLQFAVAVVLMVAFFLLLAWRSEVNSSRISRNTDLVIEQRYQSCLNGVRIIEKFNAQQRALAEIERRNTRDPLAKERVRAYEAGIQPVRPCER
jgi:hypothetical protein